MSDRRAESVEGICDECREPYEVWFAPNDFWNAVITGFPDKVGAGMLCPRCFGNRAAERFPFVVCKVCREDDSDLKLAEATHELSRLRSELLEARRDAEAMRGALKGIRALCGPNSIIGNQCDPFIETHEGRQSRLSGVIQAMDELERQTAALTTEENHQR